MTLEPTPEALTAMKQNQDHCRILNAIEQRIQEVLGSRHSAKLSLYVGPETETSSWLLQLMCSRDKQQELLSPLRSDIRALGMPLIVR